MGTADATSAASASNTGLGKDDFLKILMAQMSNMDPMSASSQDPSQMTQQMTQYSILEQITNLNTTQNQSLMANAHSQALSWNEALVVSLTAFHGRGFFATAFQPGDPQAALAALEAIIGLLIEITFIATFTQRFFAR